MQKFDDMVSKYGLTVVLMVVIGVIGVALYLWKKDDESKGAKEIRTAGLATAIIGLFIGLVSIGWTAMKEKEAPPVLNGNGGGSNGEDDFPED